MDTKVLTTENFLQLDPSGADFVKSLGEDAENSLTPEDWLALFLRVKLTPSVPPKVQSYFEMARGTLAYGYFFTPFFALAAAPLQEAAQTAVMEKCRQKGVKTVYANGKALHLQQALAWLRHFDIISKSELHQWEDLFKFQTAQGEKNQAAPPENIVNHFNEVGEKINKLFP